MIEFGLVGERLGHSFSPEIHSAFANYKYELIEISKDKIDLFFDAKEFKGLNVTIPYKETVIPHLDVIDDAAREIGAVNTVVVRSGKLYGYNTDYIGMRDAILRAGIEFANKKVLICGSGGTSKTAEYTARILGAKEIYRLSRKKTDGCITYDEVYSLHGNTDIIINATPVGMYPNEDGIPIDISKFKHLSGVFDAIFNPLCTRLVVEARRRGIKSSGGLYMLVAQAAAASEYFTGKAIDRQDVDRVYSSLLKSKLNIVLTGMPSSGKSTVGKALATALGKKFVDLDEMIVEKEGMPIPEIFEKFGEGYFRQSEMSTVKEAASLRGAVIATGGGAVKASENVDALMRNGRIYFLDRSLDKLISTPDRPLSSDRASLEARYLERIDIYNSACDVKIDSDGSISEAVASILNDFEGIK